MSNRKQIFVGSLRATGALDLLAVVAVIAPRKWIAISHQMLGMGEFPSSPVAGYLARSTSIWYAAFGFLLWFVSFDVERYSQLIQCLAWMMVAQGFLILGIDLAEGMPVWWTVIEGPCSAFLGAGLLLFHRWSRTKE